MKEYALKIASDVLGKVHSKPLIDYAREIEKYLKESNSKNELNSKFEYEPNKYYQDFFIKETRELVASLSYSSLRNEVFKREFLKLLNKYEKQIIEFNIEKFKTI